MELNEDIFNQIHLYLNEDLEEEERQKFEIQINQNPELAQEIALQRRIKSGLKVNNYKQQFSNIHSQLKQDNLLPFFEEKTVAQLNTTHSNWRYFVYAASIVLIISFGLFFYLKPHPTKQLANNNPKPSIKLSKPDKVEIAKSDKIINKTAPIDLKELFVNNFNNKPAIAPPFLSEKFGISPSIMAAWDADTLILRKGVEYLEITKTQSAIDEFQKISISKFENIKFHADWYLALAYIQKKDLLKAKKQLNLIIANEKHSYLKESKALMKILRQ